MTCRAPNVVFVFADQWRAQAVGYAGDPNVDTPALDRLAGESVNFVNAMTVHACCTPYRASLLTGQYPTTNGMFINDIKLDDNAVSIGKVLRGAGYDTAYVGKWHLHGGPNGEYKHRSEHIPRGSRQGFDYWKVLECTHNYNDSKYFGDAPDPRAWDGYDAIAQTRDAIDYIRAHADRDRPFCLFLSWGPPHDPYQTAPQEYAARYANRPIELRQNVPPEWQERATEQLRGYYSHVAALDDCVAALAETLHSTGIADDTVFVVTSDHGDMLGSQGYGAKHLPYDESVCVPFLLRYPRAHGKSGRELRMVLNTPDIMPTLLGLCGVDIPGTVEGTDYSKVVSGAAEPADTAGLTMLPAPFGRAIPNKTDEYRGVRTERYTYVATINRPWLMFDNETDPFQMNNLCGRPEAAELQAELADVLRRCLREANDEFLPGDDYVRRWGYATWIEFKGRYAHLVEES